MTQRKRRKERARRGVAKHAGHTRLGPRELRVLLLLAWVGFLTTKQITAVGPYPTLRRAQRRMRVPLDHGLTKTALQGGALHRPSIHVLTDRGREYLIDLRLLDGAYRAPRLPREQKRAHALLVRDVFVAYAIADGAGKLRLQDFRFEGDLSRQEPFSKAGLIPDAQATILLNSGQPKTVCVEADASTETTTTLREKFLRWAGVLNSWPPPPPLLLTVALRDGRRQTLARLISELGLGGRALVILTSELQSFVDRLSTPHDPAARPGRSERRTIVLQLPRVTVLSSEAAAAFRALR